MRGPAQGWQRRLDARERGPAGRRGGRAPSSSRAPSPTSRERKVLEEQLRQSQKMEAIGQLAGGIAHDFNNLLTTVLGYSNMALNQLSPPRSDPRGDRGDPEGRRARRESDAAAPGLLPQAGLRAQGPRLQRAASSSRRGCSRRLIGERIRLVTQLDPSLGSVRADPGQIEQVLLNLVVNARDAMPDGGTLTIRTRERRRRRRVRPAGTSARRRASTSSLGERHRRRDRPETAEAHLRAVLHDEGEAARNRARPGDGLRHRAPERRPGLRRERAGRGSHVRDLPSARRGGPFRRRPPSAAPLGAGARLRDDPARRGRGPGPRADPTVPRTARLRRAPRPRAPRRPLDVLAAHRGRWTCSSPTSSCPAPPGRTSRGG